MTRWARVARGTVAATVSLYIAAFSHSLAGGALPGIAGISLCLMFSVLVCTALVGRRMPQTRLAGSILVSQAMYHWLFGSLGSAASSSPATLGHVHNAPINFGAFPVHVHSPNDMLFAHVCAAIVTFVILAFGERSIAATIRVARTVIRSLLPDFADAPVLRLPTHRSGIGRAVAVRQFSRVDHSGLRYRGPPLGVSH